MPTDPNTTKAIAEFTAELIRAIQRGERAERPERETNFPQWFARKHGLEYVEPNFTNEPA